MNPVLVTVCIITYNHEKFIREAIDGVLMQRVDFSWELIIADDFSTDKTREIVLEYKEKYPDFIKLIFQEKNVGPAQNWLDLLDAPKSKYIAFFEGDDYWTDPYKLQKQVDFLEANEEYSMCFTRATLYDNIEKKDKGIVPDVLEQITLNLNDYLQFNKLLPTCTVVFNKNDVSFNFNYNLISYTIFGDGILTLSGFQNKHKKIILLNDITAKYRVNNSGSLTFSKNNINYIDSWIKTLKKSKQYFDSKSQVKAINQGILFQYGRLVAYYFEEGKYIKGLLSVFKAIPYFTFSDLKMIKDLLYPLKKNILKK